ncbi:MAG: hypothetical protein H6Q15_1562 [Bacteroidetes bacterium]|nr:hypothetical protein [Bacteroidota bacterium]
MNRKYFILSFVFCLMAAGFVSAQTQGTLNFGVTTVTHNGQYRPKHILAIWIEKDNGTTGSFVKTKLFRGGTGYRTYLTNFKAATSNTYNSVDAATGATYSSHAARTVAWNATDVDGNIVEDGNYRVCVEFTESNGSGPYSTYSFVKGPSAVSLTPAATTNFKNITLTWTPSTSSLVDIYPKNNNISVYPNPINNSAVIAMSSFISKEIKSMYLIDLTGKRVDIINHKSIDSNSQIIYSPNKNIKNGVYFIVVETPSNKYSSKINISR